MRTIEDIDTFFLNCLVTKSKSAQKAKKTPKASAKEEKKHPKAKAVAKAFPQSARSERFKFLIPPKYRLGTLFALSARKVGFVYIWYHGTEQKKADSFPQLSAFAVTKT